MWFKIKLSRNIVDEKGRDKKIQETYLTESDNFAEAGYKVVQIVGTDAEVEDVCMMKTFKPSANEYKEGNKIFVVKVAQDMNIDDTIKTVKYALPVFADNNEQLQTIMKDYISQGLDDMRLTTISETKWIFIYYNKSSNISLSFFLWYINIYIRAGSQIRTDVSIRIMITSQAESTTVPFRQKLFSSGSESRTHVIQLMRLSWYHLQSIPRCIF